MSLLLKILLFFIAVISFLNWYFSGHIYDFLFVFISKDWYKEFL